MIKSKKNAFTLIELVVVIAILGILAGIAIPKFMETVKASRGAKIVADMRTIESAVNVYYVKYGFYPTDKDASGFSDLVNNGTWPSPPIGSFTIAHTIGETSSGPTVGTCNENTAYTYTARNDYDAGDTVTLTKTTSLSNCADTVSPTVIELLTGASAGTDASTVAKTEIENLWSVLQDTITSTLKSNGKSLTGSDLKDPFSDAITEAGFDTTVSQAILTALGVSSDEPLYWTVDNFPYYGSEQESNAILYANTTTSGWNASIVVTEDGKIYVSTDANDNLVSSNIAGVVSSSSPSDEQTALENKGFTYSGITINTSN